MYSSGKAKRKSDYMKAKAVLIAALVLIFISGCSGNGEEATEYENYEPPDAAHESHEPYEPAIPEAYDPEYPEAYEPEAYDYNREIIVPDFHNYEQELAARNQLWLDLANRERNNPGRLTEMEDRVIPYGEVEMRFLYNVIGERPENGHALYIALHGGGGVPAYVNNQQFMHMQTYYRRSVNEGVHVAVRGVRDTWNTHFNYESFPIYDRLIENMILFYGVDPNRVYLMGFSAGGDGVYGVTPRMADRFAAVSMSAGHHNFVNPINFMHTPIILQCGDRDTAFNRNIETVNFGEQLRDLGYNFALNIHVNMPHNFTDNSVTSAPQRVWEDPFAWRDGGESEIISIDTNAVRFLEQHVREPIPTEIAWHLGTRAHMRAVESFYWLSAGHDVTSGVIRASFDRDANAIFVETDEYVNGGFYVLLNRQMLDFDRPVTLDVNGSITEITVESCRDILLETTLERMDPNFQFTARVRINI